MTKIILTSLLAIFLTQSHAAIASADSTDRPWSTVTKNGI